MQFRSLEEQVLYYALSGTWVIYFLGAMYLMPPVLGWSLLGLWASQRIKGENTKPIPTLVWVWILSMLVMEIALIAGHFSWDLPIPLLIKSSIGWMKGWALFAVFALVGACMKVRATVLAKAASNLANQTLWLIPIMLIAPAIGLPGSLYQSPLSMLGGPGPEYFEVQIYGAGFSGDTRWRFFAPWAPAATVAFGVLTPLILRHKATAKVTAAGIIAIVMVVMMSKSRLGLISIPCTLLFTAVLARLTSPRVLWTAAAVTVVAGLLGGPLFELAMEKKEALTQMRADSSYVRNVLARIAMYRWQTEAPIFGHGVVEAGPPIVEEMPIGSHHSWYGLLFVKGAVGFAALLVPLLVSFVLLGLRAQKSRNARAALATIIFFSFSTFTENVEMLAYLMWPGFVLIGIAAAERFFSPFSAPLGRAHHDDESQLSQAALQPAAA